MRNEYFKQIIVISESHPAIFEQKMNDALRELVNPEIVFDKLTPMTAYIIFNIRKDIPETLLELLELVEGPHTCVECPFFQKSADGRKRWHKCLHDDEKCQESTPVCEVYFVEKWQQIKRLTD